MTKLTVAFRNFAKGLNNAFHVHRMKKFSAAKSGLPGGQFACPNILIPRRENKAFGLHRKAASVLNKQSRTTDKC